MRKMGQEEKILIMQLLKQRFDELRSQATLIEKGFLETESTNTCLDEVKLMEGTKDILVPLGAGTYGHAYLTGKQDILVNIGAGIFMDMNLEQAAEFISERKKDMGNAAKAVQNDMEQIAEAITKLASEYQQESRQEDDSIKVLKQSPKK